MRWPARVPERLGTASGYQLSETEPEAQKVRVMYHRERLSCKADVASWPNAAEYSDAWRHLSFMEAQCELVYRSMSIHQGEKRLASTNW